MVEPKSSLQPWLINTDFRSCNSFQILFIYSLYQIQSMAFVCSVYTTVLLAIQRYLAISKPLEYYVEGVAATAGKNFNI